jgi:16S rRNA (guanine527-N7)-methyltransferase
VGKKARFLEAVVAGLDLHDVIIMNERAEVVGQEKSHRQQYDWAVARAVAPLETLVEYLLPLCKLGGHALAQKGRAAADEAVAALTAIARLGGAEPELRPVRLPGRSDVSYLVIIEKIRETPDRYPRRPGRPAKRPL